MGACAGRFSCLPLDEAFPCSPALIIFLLSEKILKIEEGPDIIPRSGRSMGVPSAPRALEASVQMTCTACESPHRMHLDVWAPQTLAPGSCLCCCLTGR